MLLRAKKPAGYLTDSCAKLTFKNEKENSQIRTHLFSFRGHGQRRHRDVDFAGNEVSDDSCPASVRHLVAVLMEKTIQS